MLRNITPILLLMLTTTLFGQNELVIKGNDGTNPTLYVKGNDGTNPTLYVKGEINNDNGIFQNEDGDIELTGNWTNTVSAANAKYESTGEVKFSNTAAVTIAGTMNGTAAGTLSGSGLNQFHELKINTNSTTVDITLGDDVHINSTGKLEFLADGKIVTGTNKLYVRNNNATTSIVGTSAFPATNATVGATTKYIAGNLQRKVVSGTYEYPVGNATTMIPFKLDNVTAAGAILGNVVAGATAVANSGILYCDIATHNGSSNALADASANTPDGKMDQMTVDLNSTVEWNATLESGSVATYDIEVFPGAGDIGATYASSQGNLAYLFKDGKIYNGATALATTSYPLLAFTATGASGACPSTTAGSQYKMAGLTSFSSFRVGGVSSTSALLPVELISLEANAVENKFIAVDWKTATEINNEGFEVQRSIDGLKFETVGFVNGNGNTQDVSTYTFNDTNVDANILYYYRLNQVDFDGNSEFTYNVSASLDNRTSLTVSGFIPNPSSSKSHIEVSVSSETTATVALYTNLGKLVSNNRFELTKGNNVLPIQLDNVTSGIYQSKITIGEETFFRKLNLIK